MTPPLRILITGASGCAGSHLSELALKKGAHVFGFSRRGGFVPGVAGRAGDITQREDVEAMLAGCMPDWVFHLAALVHGSGVHTSKEMRRVNIAGTDQLLWSVRTIVPGARVLVAGSSGIYGQPADSTEPIKETQPLRPLSEYASSKATQDLRAHQFYLEHGLHIVRTRTFNQTGPREPAGLVCAMLARQVARIEAGLQEPVLRVITLKTRRDFCDVRDVVAGYWAALEHGAPGETYNVCSGESRSIQQMVDILLSHAKIGSVRIEETDPDPGLGVILDQIGDSSRLRDCSRWRPRISLEQSLGDLLEEWQQKVRREP